MEHGKIEIFLMVANVEKTKTFQCYLPSLKEGFQRGRNHYSRRPAYYIEARRTYRVPRIHETYCRRSDGHTDPYSLL